MANSLTIPTPYEETNPLAAVTVLTDPTLIELNGSQV